MSSIHSEPRITRVKWSWSETGSGMRTWTWAVADARMVARACARAGQSVMKCDGVSGASSQSLQVGRL